jgi:dTDP-4-amino-4,6-dideoxygalactose transaminase
MGARIESLVERNIKMDQVDHLTQRPVAPRFEQAVATHVGVKHSLAVSSATSALHIACLALELGPGDCLWTSPVTFLASANCGLYCGAQVDFFDIDPRTYNLCVTALGEKLICAEKSGEPPKVLVAVHLYEQPCHMATIKALSQRYDLKAIEDASHAIGGRYKDEFTGGCRYSDITIFSFHPVKINTTAEGGMTLTNSDELAKWYDILLDKLPVTMPLQNPDSYSGLRLYLIRLQLEKISKTDRRPFESLCEQGICVNIHYIPVHLQSHYERMGFKAGDFLEAESYYAETISLPMYQTLNETRKNQVLSIIKKAIEK